MDTGSRQTDLFYKKCDELAQGGFILADTKLAELLQCIAASDVLYAFFRNLTKDFDYPAALEKYLYGAQGGRLEMPEEPGERLAFSFCLLVDIDAKRIPLGDLLHGHFSAEGGVHASFLAFCEEVVLPFKRGVRRLLSGNTAAAAAAKRAARAALKELVSAERDEVYAARGLSDERKVDALVILNALGVGHGVHAHEVEGAAIWVANGKDPFASLNEDNRASSAFSVAALGGMDVYVYRGLYLGTELGFDISAKKFDKVRFKSDDFPGAETHDTAKNLNIGFYIEPTIRLGYTF